MEVLKRKIKSAEDLQSVVRTMKALAAVSIRQYERAVESLDDYTRGIQLGLQAVLRERPESTAQARASGQQRLGAVVFGSDQGMCGQLNEQIITHALGEMDRLGAAVERRVVWVVGERASGRVQDEGQAVEKTFGVPSSVGGITPKVQEVLLEIEAAHAARGLDEVYLCYSEHLSAAVYRPRTLRFLPVDQAWLSELRSTPWPTNRIPLFTLGRARLFSALIHQYLFVSLYRAFAESLASENASRLAAMQNAEKNIEELLTDLRRQFHQLRQTTITSELLDIVAGFEALKES